VQWLFGKPEKQTVHLRTSRKMSGVVELEKARVRWFLSVDAEDLPRERREAGQYAYRSMTMDGEEIEFSTGFTDLHTRVYEDILAGGGYGISDARPGVELVHEINHSDISASTLGGHPLLETTSVRSLEDVRRAA